MNCIRFLEWATSSAAATRGIKWTLQNERRAHLSPSPRCQTAKGHFQMKNKSSPVSHCQKKKKPPAKLNILNAYCAYIVANDQETVQTSGSCQEFVHLDVSLTAICRLTQPRPLLLSRWPDVERPQWSTVRLFGSTCCKKEWSAGVLMRFDALSHLNSTFDLTLLCAGWCATVKSVCQTGFHGLTAVIVWLSPSTSSCLPLSVWPLTHPTQERSHTMTFLKFNLTLKITFLFFFSFQILTARLYFTGFFSTFVFSKQSTDLRYCGSLSHKASFRCVIVTQEVRRAT